MGGEKRTERQTEMGAGRVSAARVVVLAADALESGGLVYWHGRCAILVLVVRVLDGRAEGGEAVGLAGSVGRVWFWSGELDGADDVEKLWKGHGRRRRESVDESARACTSDRTISARDGVIMPRATTRDHRERHSCSSSAASSSPVH